MVGVLSHWLITRDSKKIDKLERNIVKLSQQVKSYWNLEKLYSKEVSRLTGVSDTTILKKYRDEVENLGFERPKMTSNDVDKIKDSIEC